MKIESGSGLNPFKVRDKPERLTEEQILAWAKL